MSGKNAALKHTTKNATNSTVCKTKFVLNFKDSFDAIGHFGKFRFFTRVVTKTMLKTTANLVHFLIQNRANSR